MLGAIIGDVIGSVFEWHNNKSTEFSMYSRFTRFTDDTVLTVAIADAILSRKRHQNKFVDYVECKKLYANMLRHYYSHFPNAGYGQKFEEWAKNSTSKPYKSFGNGSAMRVSPIGFASQSLEEALNLNYESL
ncbi:ADP-ribosylglycohydrolase family protein [Paenibacillus sp. strain BS8-2]